MCVSVKFYIIYSDQSKLIDLEEAAKAAEKGKWATNASEVILFCHKFSNCCNVRVTVNFCSMSGIYIGALKILNILLIQTMEKTLKVSKILIDN